MKINTKTLIYLYAIALFLITDLLATEIIHAIKTGEFDYLNLLIYIVLDVFFIVKIIQLGKFSNSEKN